MLFGFGVLFDHNSHLDLLLKRLTFGCAVAIQDDGSQCDLTLAGQRSRPRDACLRRELAGVGQGFCLSIWRQERKRGIGFR